MKKGLDHLDAARQKLRTITDRFASFQAQTLNVPVDFPLVQRLALPITIGTVRYPGIRIQDFVSSACWRSSCTGARPREAGPPSRSTKPFLQRFGFPLRLTA